MRYRIIRIRRNESVWYTLQVKRYRFTFWSTITDTYTDCDKMFSTEEEAKDHARMLILRASLPTKEVVYDSGR